MVYVKEKQEVWPDNIPNPLMKYAPAVKAGNWVFVAGQLASDFKTGVAPETIVNPKMPNHGNTLQKQSKYIMKNIERTLKAAGTSYDDSMRIMQWFVANKDWDGNPWCGVNISPYLEERNNWIKDKRPASTGMGLRELLVKDTILEVNLINIIPQEGEVKEAISCDSIPKPLAGYSEAVKCGDWVFMSGELSTDWVGDYGRSQRYGEDSSVAIEARTNPFFWYDYPIRRQTEYQLKKLQAIAESAGTSLDRMVKSAVYLPRPEDYIGFEEVWKYWFPKNPPARTIIPNQGLGGKGCLVEIAPKLLSGDSKLKIETIETSDAPEPIFHEPQAVKAGDFLFLSGQMACDKNGVAKEAIRHPNFPYYGSVGRMQMEYMMKNISAICEAAGTSVDNICNRICFHDNFHDGFQEAIDTFFEYLPAGKRCASTTLAIGGPLMVPECRILLDLIGFIPPKG